MEITAEPKILECRHCGNCTPHRLAFEHYQSMLYDEIDDGEKIGAPFKWAAYICGTCGGLNLYGKFIPEDTTDVLDSKLYPKGSDLKPPIHTVSPEAPIPQRILRVYEEIWPLRHRTPAAFVGQTRRLLEFICQDQQAKGKDLFAQLKDLVTKGIFPGHFSDITELLRKVGNLGAHAGNDDVSVWDAELIDEFFRSAIEYVYIAPARVRRMKERLARLEKNTRIKRSDA